MVRRCHFVRQRPSVMRPSTTVLELRNRVSGGPFALPIGIGIVPLHPIEPTVDGPSRKEPLRAWHPGKPTRLHPAPDRLHGHPGQGGDLGVGVGSEIGVVGHPK
jgi:hypothetical protein